MERLGPYILATFVFIVGAFTWFFGMAEGANTETVFQQIYARQFITAGLVLVAISFLIGSIGALFEAVTKQKTTTDFTGVEKRLDEVNDNLMMLKSTYAHPQTEKQEG